MCKFRDFEKYEVYPDGRIWSYKTNRFLKPQTNKYGYQQVRLYDNYGNAKTYLVHRVVYETFSGEPIPSGMQVNHINEIKTDNRFFENLNLMSPKDNCNWGTRNSRSAKASSKARINGKCSKAVGAFKNNELVMVFPSTMEAQRQGFDCGHISACCNGKLKTHKGYTWKYL